MAKIKSARDILISTDFLAAREKTAQYVHHEFQDYAIRLSHDLGDTQHRGIFMRLAKTVDRTLLEQAAAFALGYFDEPNKGKIFMWKVQQLRRQAQQKKDMKNLDHDFVVPKMTELMKVLRSVYTAKQKSQFESEIQEIIDLLISELINSSEKKSPDKLRVLVLGCGCGYETSYIERLGFRTFGLGLSPQLVKTAKAVSGTAKITRKKNVLENKYKDNYFDLIFIPERLWQIIPSAAEANYINELIRLKKDDGILSIGFTEGSEVESWKQFEWQEQTHIRFVKESKSKQVSDLIELKNVRKRMITPNYIMIQPS